MFQFQYATFLVASYGKAKITHLFLARSWILTKLKHNFQRHSDSGKTKYPITRTGMDPTKSNVQLSCLHLFKTENDIPSELQKLFGSFSHSVILIPFFYSVFTIVMSKLSHGWDGFIKI